MKYPFLLSFSFLFLFTFNTEKVNAQVISAKIVVGDSTQVHELNTLSGDRFVGLVTKIENTTITFLFQKKIELTFDFSEVQSLQLQSESSRIGYDNRKTIGGRPAELALARRRKWENRRNEPVLVRGTENLFVSPTAFTFGRGKGEFRNTMVVYNQIEFGVGDYVNLGFDIMPLFAFNVFAGRIKVGLSPTEYFHIAAGGNLFITNEPFNFGIRDETRGATHTYGVATIGDRDKHLNVGVGYGFPFDPEFTQGASTLSFGGAFRFAERWKATLDFLIIGDQTNNDFYNVGVSWFDNYNRWDFGVATIIDNDNVLGVNTIPFPFVTYARMFGK